MEVNWWDQSKDWWPRILRARELIAELERAEATYLAEASWKLEPEPTDEAYTFDLRFCLRLAPPPAVSLLAGDVVHNLSAALDYLAYALARAHYGPTLDTDKHLRKLSEFPVKYSWDDVVEWSRQGRRRELFGECELRALWWGQSYYWTDTGHRDLELSDQELAARSAESRSRDPFTILRELNNADKHRKLSLAFHSPDMPHWGSQGSTKRKVAVSPFWEDGQIVARMFDPPSDALDTVMNWDLRLTLDEGNTAEPAVQLLERLRHSVAQSVHAVASAMNT